MRPNPFGLAYTQSPVDLPEPVAAPPHALRWTSVAIATATLLLAALNAHAIRGWARQLPPGPQAEQAVRLAEGWYDAVDAADLNRLVSAVHDGWGSLKAMRFPGQEEAPVPSSRSSRQ